MRSHDRVIHVIGGMIFGNHMIGGGGDGKSYDKRSRSHDRRGWQWEIT